MYYSTEIRYFIHIKENNNGNDDDTTNQQSQTDTKG